MTPLDAGGQNGGAGLVAVSLVRHMSALENQFDFTLLTAQGSHAELASLDAHNVRRVCVVARPSSPTLARRVAYRLLPPPARRRIQQLYWSMRTSRKYGRATDDSRPDLLFCPFTVPYFWRPGVPCVSIVHDLQDVTYPQFFTSEQRLNRKQHVADACQKSDRVVCVSNYVRVTLLANQEVCSARVLTIPHGLLLEAGNPDYVVLERLGLHVGEFVLYPANFWPHKNHRTLFEALRIFREMRPESRLKLVCTGAPNALMQTLKVAAESLLAPGTVVFAEYVSRREFLALLDATRALVFPSLYEGFGMPILEAMAWGKPVLCSNVTSLPEVAGDAGSYFDPSDPRQIASAIDALDLESATIAEKVKRGRQRAAAFGQGRELAMRYLTLFRQVMSANAA
jgi:glycosyltransferase involved in cell wall biosynthesis